MMKNKLLALVLALSLVMAFAMPAAATDEVVTDNTTEVTNVTANDDVNKVYEAFIVVQAALDSGNVDILKTAIDGFYEVMDIFNEFGEDEFEALAGLFGVENAEAVYSLILGDWVDANVLNGVIDTVQTYLDNKNTLNAYNLVETVKSYEDMYEDLSTLKAFITDFDAIYEDAKANLPSENVLNVYNTFKEVQECLEYGDIDGLKEAVDKFYEIVDVFNELTEEELADLAVLFEVEDGGAAYSLVLSDWIDANVIVSFNETYNAFVENANKDTAQTLIEAVDGYDAMSEDRTALYAFFYDIDDLYAEAKAIVNGSDTKDETTNKRSPQTGDETQMLFFAGMMLASAVVLADLKKRRA